MKTTATTATAAPYPRRSTWRSTLSRAGFSIVLGALLPVVIIALWEVAARAQWTQSQILVPPSAVLATIVEFAQSGELLADIVASTARVFIGLLVGGGLGFLFGIATGLNARIAAILEPTFHVLRQIPVIAWVPLLVLLAGFGEGFKIATIAIAAFFPIALNTLDGIRNVSPALIDAGRALCFSQWDILRRIVWPAALPTIMSGLRLSSSRAWMLVVAAELVASTSGIGHRMDWGRQLFQIDIVLMGVLVTGTVGLLLDLLFRTLTDRATAWRQIR